MCNCKFEFKVDLMFVTKKQQRVEPVRCLFVVHDSQSAQVWLVLHEDFCMRRSIHASARSFTGAMALALLGAVATPAYAALYTNDYGVQLAATSNCDDCFDGPISFGAGQNINFFGTVYGDLYVGSNGYVTFGGGATSYSTTPLNVQTIRPMIAGVYTDLDSRDDAASNVYVNTTIPGQIVVTWLDMGHFSRNYSVRSTFQLVIRSDQFAAILPGESKVGFYYGNITDGSAANGGFGDGLAAINPGEINLFSGPASGQSNVTQTWFNFSGGIPAQDGTCGSANGVGVTTAPASNLCGFGTPSAVSTAADQFTWTCEGAGGGATASCSAPHHYTLTTSVTGNGSVAPSSGTYAYNSNVVVTAVPTFGSTFIAWGGNCLGTPSTSCTLTMTGDRVATALFAITGDSACGRANNVPTVNPPTDLCSAGSPSRIQTSNSSYSWSCAGANGGEEAVCRAPRHYLLNTSVVGLGSIDVYPMQASYAYNTNVFLTAKPGNGQVLVAWSGDCTGDDSSCNLTVAANKTVVATFGPAPVIPENISHFSKLYLAAFLRAAELEGMNYWSNQVLVDGKSYVYVGGVIFSLPIVTDLYPLTLSDKEFVSLIYHNVFGRDGDDEGVGYWAGELLRLRNSFLAQDSVNPGFEARGQLVMDMITAGLGTPDGTLGKVYIENRLEVAIYAIQQQTAQGKQLSPAQLRSIMDTVGADRATARAAKKAIDAALRV
jgi:hypothetical protein